MAGASTATRFTSAPSFINTNVLVNTDDHDHPDRQARALELVAAARRSGKGVVSTQVLQEYFVVATGKLGVDPRIARRKVEIFARLHLQLVDLENVLAAVDLQIVHHLSFWDALIIAAAKSAGCRVLYSEDLQTGAMIAGIQVVNPFLQAP